MRLSVIIVSYNVKYFLEQCLCSLERALAAIDGEVLVVDNHSGDGSLDYLEPLFPAVRFISSEENLGFARANNLGLRQARGEWVLFLNPDTLVPEDAILSCLEWMDRKPEAGALGIRMIDGSGRFLPESKRSFPGIATAFYKLTGMSALFPRSRVFNKYALGYLDEHRDHPVDVLAGAFMLIRHAALAVTGGFDEQFFMYGEDIDLSYRLKQAGFQNWYFAGSSIIHFKGESSRKGSIHHTRLFYRAMIVFVGKHYRSSRSLLMRRLLQSGIRLRGLWAMATGLGTGKNRNDQAATPLLVVAAPDEYLACCRLLAQADLSGEIRGRAADDQESPLPVTGISELKTFCNREAITAVVFCTGKMNYRQVFLLVEELGPAFKFYFHASGSGSIISSSSHAAQGETIPRG